MLRSGTDRRGWTAFVFNFIKIVLAELHVVSSFKLESPETATEVATQSNLPVMRADEG